MANSKAANIHNKATKIKKTPEDIIINVVVYLICAIVFILTVYPFYYCVVISFNEGNDASLGGIFWWPRKPTLENYEQVFKNKQLMPVFGVTIARTLIGTVTSVLFTGIIAYALAHKELVFRNFYFTVLIIAMYVSGGTIPTFLLYKNIGLYDTFWVYVVPSLFGIWNCILMMNFFREIPASLEESARIDGANDVTIFFRIIIPVSMPILATIALFNGVGHWNDWYATAFYTKSRSLQTAASQLKEIIAQSNLTAITSANPAMSMENAQRQVEGATQNFTAETIRMATMVVTVFPITVIYPFLQKYFVKGIMIGSIKG